MLAGQRVIVDTGVAEYEAGPLRDYVRSTKAHNTVSVDGDEQSEIWGEFRVARRAKKIGAQVSSSNNMVNFQGSFRGFFKVNAKIEHRRSVDVLTSPDLKMFHKVIVTDQVTGKGQHLVESFIHLHPDIEMQHIQNNEFDLMHNKSRMASIRLPEDQGCRVDKSVYCPEFGKKIPNQVLVLFTQGTLPMTLRYEIQVDVR
jgi:uncharacterized heparinase superfamily protein